MKYNYKVPCKKEKLIDIRSFIRGVLEKVGLSEIDISTLVLAIDEVCANLIIHAHSCNPNESIELEIIVSKEQLEFNIIDKAEMFDIGSYEEPSLDDIIKKQRKGGLGLILVKRIMDDIQIQTKNDCHVCKLIKKID